MKISHIEDEILNNNVVFLDMKGNIISKLYIKEFIVGISFTRKQDLLILINNGTFLTINHTFNDTKFYSINPKQSFENNEINHLFMY